MEIPNPTPSSSLNENEKVELDVILDIITEVELNSSTEIPSTSIIVLEPKSVHLEDVRSYLHDLIKKENKNKIAKEIGISSSTLTNFVNKKTKKPRATTIEKILNFTQEHYKTLKMSDLMISGTSKIQKAITKEDYKIEKNDSSDILNSTIESFESFLELIYMFSDELTKSDLEGIIQLYDETTRQYKLTERLVKGYDNDYEGYIYYYFIEGEPNEIKIGRGKEIQRIRNQASKNKKYYYFNYGGTDKCKLMERVVHIILDEKRFEKGKGIDGRTEWFRTSEDDVIEAITIAYKLLEIK